MKPMATIVEMKNEPIHSSRITAGSFLLWGFIALIAAFVDRSATWGGSIGNPMLFGVAVVLVGLGIALWIKRRSPTQC
jgi:hypothetical protein